MRVKRLLSIAVFVIVLASGQRSDAGMFTELGRYLGWGVSDGYHAHNRCYGCSPTWHVPHHTVPAQPPGIYEHSLPPMNSVPPRALPMPRGMYQDLPYDPSGVQPWQSQAP
jgi:hypothetical protein